MTDAEMQRLAEALPFVNRPGFPENCQKISDFVLALVITRRYNYGVARQSTTPQPRKRK